MNIDTLLMHISGNATLTDTEVESLKSVLIPRPFKQGEIIVNAGDTARYLMYVTEGYVMTYFTGGDGTDQVVQFAADGWWTGDLFSLSKENKTLYTTKALCDGEMLLLPRSAQSQLLDNHINIEKYFRKLFHNALMRQQMRIIENNINTAEERYNSLITTYPKMEQFVPQKYIASYIGITPEFLSKIRKNKTGILS